MPTPDEIVFNGKSAWDLERDSMRFEALVDGRKLRCFVTGDALEDHFQASRKTHEQAFAENRAQIEAVAKRLLCGGRINPGGEVYIMTADFGPPG